MKKRKDTLPDELRRVLEEYESLTTRRNRKMSRDKALTFLANKNNRDKRTIERWLSKAKELAKKDKQEEEKSRTNRTNIALPHQSELEKEAKWLVDVWLEALSSGHAPDGYIIDRDSAVFESIKLKNGDLLEGLLSHLKYEFPENFNHLSKWESLFTNELTPQGFKSLRKAVRRGNFQGTCDICKDW